MYAKFTRELATYNLPRGPSADVPAAPVTEVDIAPLPDAVQRYFRFTGVLGRPRDWSFRLDFNGGFRRTPDEKWMRCEAWQYNTLSPVARIFYITIKFGGLVPVIGRDTYVQGKGRMLIRLFDLVTVGDGRGEEYDIGELVTYLNDCIFIAPSMLLMPAVRFVSVDARSFDVSMTNYGHTVTARVSLDEQGAPVNFSTTDRWYADPKDANRLVRSKWTTPIEGWREVAGRQLWTRGRAVWHMPAGEFAYADFEPVAGSLTFNVAAEG